MAKKLGLYIHLPFCKTKCAYCDFYSQASTPSVEEEMDLYQKAVLAHIKATAPSAHGYSVDTIYFGGGTPSFYGGARIDGLLRSVRRLFRVERDAEITVEGNPDSITLTLINQLRRSGVNRISLGMQSALLTELRSVGRPHTPQDTREAVCHVKKGRITNLSLDLIYGLPQQTLERWQQTLEEAIALEPEHLSCYGLKVEEGTPLFQRVAQGELLPDDDVQADLYLWTVERLKQSGYEQYEISNFAKNKLISRHNMGYWTGKPYLGFGASASSDFGGYRSSFLADREAYCGCVLEGGGDLFDSHQLMGSKDRQQEYLFLRLRTQEGIQQGDYEKHCQLPFGPLEGFFREAATQGWVESFSPHGWRFTPEGYLRSNLLIGQLLDLQEVSIDSPTPPRSLSQVKEEVAKQRVSLSGTLGEEEELEEKGEGKQEGEDEKREGEAEKREGEEEEREDEEEEEREDEEEEREDEEEETGISLEEEEDGQFSFL